MSSGDFSVDSLGDKYTQSKTEWDGPQQSREVFYWEHEAGTVVEVAASTAGLRHDDSLVWSVIVRPDRNSPGRRITQAYLDSREAAFKRAGKFCEDHPEGDLPKASFDEWGVRE